MPWAYSKLKLQLRLRKEEDAKRMAAQPSLRFGLLLSAFLPIVLNL